MFDQQTLRQDIFDLSCKIARIKNILATDVTDITIFFLSKNNLGDVKGSWVCQDEIPFNLSGELRLLLEDSVIELERQLQTLKSLQS